MRKPRTGSGPEDEAIRWPAAESEPQARQSARRQVPRPVGRAISMLCGARWFRCPRSWPCFAVNGSPRQGSTRIHASKPLDADRESTIALAELEGFTDLAK